MIEIYGTAKVGKIYEPMVTYNIESQEEWGDDKRFDFSMDDYDWMEKFKCEFISHKELEFKAKNREKLSFRFKPDSYINIESITVTIDGKGSSIKNILKYYLNNKNLDVDIIFNKKGKYKLTIQYHDNSEKNIYKIKIMLLSNS